jgi:hypothetical protein
MPKIALNDVKAAQPRPPADRQNVRYRAVAGLNSTAELGRIVLKNSVLK